MELSLEKAKELASVVLVRHGMPDRHAEIVADHLVYAATTGYAYAGLPRVLVLVEQLQRKGPGGEISVLREEPHSAVIDGADVSGYVTSLVAIDKAIELGKANRFAVVGVRDSWFNGLLSFYTERAARQDLIGVHTANSPAMVAPHGGMDRIFGTNPIAFSFPARGNPLTIDVGTSAVTWGDVLLRKRTGRLLEEGSAIDKAGYPTTDPGAALDGGALLPWGGHKAYGLSLVVQALGILSGSKVVIDDIGNCGFFFMVFDPTLLMPIEEFKDKIGELRRHVESSRPRPGVESVRVPGAGSQRRRKQTLARGTIVVDDGVYEALCSLAR